jgi:pimeloyl-ACP methyl ester carboxylesterase
MLTVTSKDGTSIAYDQQGNGPVVILVTGAFGYRRFPMLTELAGLLDDHLTVITYDRRGRGDSGDTQPYAVEREIEDIDALIEAAGGTAALWGLSSGAALALEAANRLGPTKVTRLSLYEAPYYVDDSHPPVPDGYRQHVEDLIAAGQRSKAVTYFMRSGIGLPAPIVALMHVMPAWSRLKAVAHTLPYDIALVVDHEHGRPLPKNAWPGATMPTSVVYGGKSPVSMKNAMRAVADTLPNAHLSVLEGQTHIVKARALAPSLIEFFTSDQVAKQ